MDVRLLGPLELRHGDRLIDLGDPQQQYVLVVLLLNANRPVSTERLIETVWAGKPKKNNPVPHYISGIRAAFAAAGVPEDVASVERVSAGYRLRIDPECLDVERFWRLLSEAETGDQTRRREALHAAVELWRGDYLDGLNIDRVGGVDVLSPGDAYLDALGDLAELELGQRRHRWVRDHLRPVVARDPTRQRLAALLMRALMANGDMVQAVDVYYRTRDALDESGVQVSVELRRLLARAKRVEQDNRLPIPVRLVGRVDKLREIRSRVLEAAGDELPARVWISGPPGVGKSALAVAAAHELRERCPDHQVVIDLNGSSPNVAPTSVFDGLGAVLEGLGVPTEQIPDTIDERIRAYRGELAGTRSLVVLDNAVSEEQVRELLPVAPGCIGLVTSRHSAGVAAVDVVRLDPLSVGSAAALFAEFVGADRVAGQDQLVAEVAGRCGGIPLQIRVVAGQFRMHRSWSLEHLVVLLKEADTWQPGSALGDAGNAAISVSYRQLSDPQRTLFRLLSALPGPDLGVAAAAALGHCSVRTARALLEELHAASLLEENVPERYRMLDPIKEYAAALRPAFPDEAAEAMDRLLDFQLVTAAAAMRAAFPVDRQPELTVSSPVALEFRDAAAAREWLGTERQNLSAAIRYAAEHGRSGHVWRLAVLLWRWHSVRGQVGEWVEALELARTLLDVPDGDRLGLALVLLRLSNVLWLTGRDAEALELAARALSISRTLRDEGGEASALTAIALVNLRAGAHDSAIAHFEEALEYYRRAEDTRGQAHVLSNLGHLHDMRGDLTLAERRLTEAVAMLTELGHAVGLVHTLENRGCVRQVLGDIDGAVADHEQARNLAVELGDVSGQAYAVNSIGRAYRRGGRLAEALAMHDTARELADQVTDPDLRTQLYLDRGETLRANGDYADARDAYFAAFDLGAGERGKVARAALGAARVLHAVGDCAAAAEYWQTAITEFEKLGAPEADEARAEYAGLSCPCVTSAVVAG